LRGVTAHTRNVTPRSPIPTRRAPAGLRLPVPMFVRLWGAVLGLLSTALGLVFLASPVPNRTPALEARSVVAVIEVPLGIVLVAAGLWVVAATMVGHSRASAHAVAAVAHLTHVVALGATFVIAYPLQPLPVLVLASFAVIAHGGACLDYWSRGWR
jgi:hypothetical protein